MGSIGGTELGNKSLYPLKSIEQDTANSEYGGDHNQPRLDVDIRRLLGGVLVPVQPVVEADPALDGVGWIPIREHDRPWPGEVGGN